MNLDMLKEVGDILDGQVKNGDVVGGAVAVFKDGEQIYRRNSGFADRERGIPVRDDTIYRIYSMTKPITAAAVMILYDRGLFRLEDKLSDYIPEFAHPTVLQPDGREVPAESEITIRQTLDMTSGLCYPDQSYPAGRKMEEVYSEIARESDAGKRVGTLELIRRAAKSPLAFQPGEKWMYGIGADVAGALVEVLTGMSYREYLKKEIFEPLGMVDTDFYVPQEKMDRFSEMYIYNEESKQLETILWQHLGLRGFFKELPAFESGGAGLVSTIDDYKKFADMMMNRGVYGGKRILSEEAVDLITHNNLTPSQAETFNWDQCRGCGYSILNRCVIDLEAAGAGNLGDYGWDGWLGSYYSNDPTDKVTLIYMIQRAGGFGSWPCLKMKELIYKAIK